MAVTGFIGGAVRIEFVNSVVTDGPTIAIPAWVEQGDLMVLQDIGNGGTGSVIPHNIPTGWVAGPDVSHTGIITGLGSSRRMTTSFQVAGPTDAGSTVSGLDASVTGTHNEAKLLLIFRGSRRFTAAALADNHEVVSAGNPSAQVLSVTTDTPPLVSFMFSGRLGGAISTDTFLIGGNDARDGSASYASAGTFLMGLKTIWKAFTKPAALADVTCDHGNEGNVNFLFSMNVEITT